ncbi:MAG: Uncharacterized protein XD63_1552 [Thermoanaerobacterales bacterium 50_218]|nr:MAG: Uncharacterized protein XD63_1552 [Thermoanaerobacterales bacterium 50_218]
MKNVSYQFRGNTMDFEIVLILVLLLGLIYYFRQAHTLQNNKNRVIDLLVIGIVFSVSKIKCLH